MKFLVIEFLVIVGVVLGSIALIILAINLIRGEIDYCFDSGGRWNHETELCEYE